MDSCSSRCCPSSAAAAGADRCGYMPNSSPLERRGREGAICGPAMLCISVERVAPFSTPRRGLCRVRTRARLSVISAPRLLVLALLALQAGAAFEGPLHDPAEQGPRQPDQPSGQHVARIVYAEEDAAGADPER